MAQDRIPYPAMRRATLFLFVVLSACVVAPATLPLDSECRIEVQLAGQPLRMVLDTGSMGILLAAAAVDRLGLERRPMAGTVTDSTGLVRPVEAVVDFDDLWLGNLGFQGDAVCMPVPAQVGDGLVGMTLLGHAVWLVDIPGKMLHMGLEADAEAIVAAHGFQVVARLPLGADPLRPQITVRLEGQEDATLLLDSGAVSTSLPAAVVARLALPPGDELARQRAKDRQERLQAEFDDLNDTMFAGGVKVTVTVPPDDGGATGVHGVRAQYPLHHLRGLTLAGQAHADLLVTARDGGGLLGRDVLGTFPWLLHGPRHELWVLRKP